MADHRPVAVIDLRFFAGRGGDHDASLSCGALAQRHDEAPHAGIARGKAVAIDQVLPDRHGIPAARECLDDQLWVRLARARTWRTARTHDGAPSRSTPPPWWPDLAGESRWTPRQKWPVLTRPGRWTPAPAK